ncbi:hypothetical protein A1Q2_05648 [Trichosporon asahii var. asahii CBS 8904]|uniref:Uncharacterized protein n=1 Tax=Trichosporon asahii var. asahii (strain CBS 8904) TaxID=1220162 RepID=K1VGW1_TRIAC|nr:hypothetical protein A1Q2_05648 [Trichosporon asahii var. asahii CBS 8904]
MQNFTELSIVPPPAQAFMASQPQSGVPPTSAVQPNNAVPLALALTPNSVPPPSGPAPPYSATPSSAMPRSALRGEDAVLKANLAAWQAANRKLKDRVLALSQQQIEHWRSMGAMDVQRARGREQLAAAMKTLETWSEDMLATYDTPIECSAPGSKKEAQKREQRIDLFNELKDAVDELARIAEESLRPLPPATGRLV